MSILKFIHVGCVILSLASFTLRASWMLTAPARLRERWVRIAPHMIDTVLLASAVALAFQIKQGPFVHHWLTAKVLALVVYIVLGSIALKRGKTRRVRIAALMGATMMFFYIIAVALTRSPWPLG